jgi:hypothetical protein
VIGFMPFPTLFQLGRICSTSRVISMITSIHSSAVPVQQLFLGRVRVEPDHMILSL